MIERMNKLIKSNLTFLRVKSKYSNMTTEDIKQTARCAYCFNPDIDISYQSGDIKTASRLLMREYVKLVKYENQYGVDIQNNDRICRLVARLESSYEECYDIEEVIFSIPDELILEKIKEIVGADNYKFLIKYYEVGMNKCCDIYGLETGYCRLKVSRLISKIRDNI